MSNLNSIIYVDQSEVLNGKLDDLKKNIGELISFVETKESRIISYNVYFSENNNTMTIINIHPDSSSLEYHMKVGGPVFTKFKDLIRLLRIDIYGNLCDNLIEQLQKKAQMLGNGKVFIHRYYGGFGRFGLF